MPKRCLITFHSSCRHDRFISSHYLRATELGTWWWLGMTGIKLSLESNEFLKVKSTDQLLIYWQNALPFCHSSSIGCACFCLLSLLCFLYSVSTSLPLSGIYFLRLPRSSKVLCSDWLAECESSEQVISFSHGVFCSISWPSFFFPFQPDQYYLLGTAVYQWLMRCLFSGMKQLKKFFLYYADDSIWFSFSLLSVHMLII